jgi:hypothetical protein
VLVVTPDRPPGPLDQRPARRHADPQGEGCPPERQLEGIAKAEGAYKGGTRRLDRETVRAMFVAGQGPAAIAKALRCSRMQVYRVLGEGTSTGA